jgi:arginyl-tRNA synthetase
MAIGESLARILRYCGHEVVGHSHVGDFGMPMSVIISYLLEQERAASDSQPPAEYSRLSATELSQLYVRAQAKLKEDSMFEAFVRSTFSGWCGFLCVSQRHARRWCRVDLSSDH